MSWVRFGTACKGDMLLNIPDDCCPNCPGSDVYVFESTEGGIECFGCRLLGGMSRDRAECFVCETPREMLAHLLEHHVAGHHVPLDLLELARHPEIEIMES